MTEAPVVLKFIWMFCWVSLVIFGVERGGRFLDRNKANMHFVHFLFSVAIGLSIPALAWYLFQ